MMLLLNEMARRTVIHVPRNLQSLNLEMLGVEMGMGMGKGKGKGKEKMFNIFLCIISITRKERGPILVNICKAVAACNALNRSVKPHLIRRFIW